jgi:hypothetical protein
VLKPGQEWASVLYQRLARCDAAVVLLSPQALASPWVRREVNILLWRRALGAPLHIVPALLEGLGSTALQDAGFTELKPIQFARSKSTGLIVDEILGEFVNLPEVGEDRSPMCLWLSAIEECLNYVRQDKALEAAAQILSIDDASVDQVHQADGRAFLAHLFLEHFEHDDVCGLNIWEAIRQVADFIPLEWLTRLARKVIPTWIDGAAARRLLKSPDDPGGVVLLNAYFASTGEQFIARASCCDSSRFRVEAIDLTTGEAMENEFLQKCDEAVDKLIGFRGGPPRDEWIDMFLEEPPDRRAACYVIVVPPNTSGDWSHIAAAVRAAEERYSWVTFLLLVGATLPTEEDLAKWNLHAKVLPRLRGKQEFNGRQMVDALAKLQRELGKGAA